MATTAAAGSGKRAAEHDRTRATRALQALNVFMADVPAGIGPFLGVFLRQRGWATGPIGTAMTAGGVAGMLCTAPADAVTDHTAKKRLVLVVTGICTVAASFLILLSQSGLAMVGAGKGDPAAFTATTAVVAQAVMIVTALVAMRVAAGRGYWLVLLVSFAALPVHGLIAGSRIEHWGVWPVLALDGVGAGLHSVAVPRLVARLLNETGRVNVGQGAVMMVQGIGASLSPAIGGWLAQLVGYRIALFTLGFALGSLALWIGFAATLRPACAGVRDGAPAA